MGALALLRPRFANHKRVSQAVSSLRTRHTSLESTDILLHFVVSIIAVSIASLTLIEPHAFLPFIASHRESSRPDEASVKVLVELPASRRPRLLECAFDLPFVCFRARPPREFRWFPPAFFTPRSKRFSTRRPLLFGRSPPRPRPRAPAPRAATFLLGADATDAFLRSSFAHSPRSTVRASSADTCASSSGSSSSFNRFHFATGRLVLNALGLSVR